MEAGAFPSDAHAVRSQIRWHGLDPDRDLILLKPRQGEDLLRPDDIAETLEEQGDRLAMVLLPGVQYRTGQWLPVDRLTAVARRQGALVGVDLAHAAGNLPLSLHDWNVDFAVWCSYKYLNGGPGAPGGAFVHARHGHGGDRPKFQGWWGTDPQTRFRMEERFVPQAGAGAWQLSNPPVLAMAALMGSLAVFQQAGIPALRTKSEALTGMLEQLLRQAGADATLLTPQAAAERGCQLSLRLGRNARAVVEELEGRGIIVDFRPPDILRVAPVPLYNRFTDVVRFVRALHEAQARPAS